MARSTMNVHMAYAEMSTRETSNDASAPEEPALIERIQYSLQVENHQVVDQQEKNDRPAIEAGKLPEKGPRRGCWKILFFCSSSLLLVFVATTIAATIMAARQPTSLWLYLSPPSQVSRFSCYLADRKFNINLNSTLKGSSIPRPPNLPYADKYALATGPPDDPFSCGRKAAPQPELMVYATFIPDWGDKRWMVKHVGNLTELQEGDPLFLARNDNGKVTRVECCNIN